MAAKDSNATGKDAKASGRGAKATGRGAKSAGRGKGKDGKAPRGERWRQIVAAFRVTRQRDPLLPLWMILGFAGGFGVVLLAFTLLGGPLYLTIVLAVLAGVLALTIVFGRRAQKAAFREVEGQPGAAAWVLQGLGGDWRVTQGVALSSQLDSVHRVLGKAGVVLIAEGAPHRTRTLLAQEKKRTARVAGDTPIYDIVLGDAEGEVSLRRLSNYLMKLPRNLTGAQLNALEKRLQALGGTKTPPLPKGPMPRTARLSGLERTIRRR